jgi:hypothetical protein
MKLLRIKKEAAELTVASFFVLFYISIALGT